MLCPKCRAEYKEGIERCSDCGVPLVKELPPEPKAAEEEFEDILATKNQGDIAILKSILDQEDITYYFHGEDFQRLYSSALGPAVLKVRKDQARQARELIEDLDLRYTGVSVGGGGDEEDTAEAPEDSLEADATPPAVVERVPGSVKLVIALLLLAVIVLGLKLDSTRRDLRAFERPSPLYETSWVEREHCFESRWKDTGRISSRTCLSPQGEVMRVTNFFPSGAKNSELFDKDGNGIFERVDYYATDGSLIYQLFDIDENGVYERHVRFGPGKRRVSRSLDRDEDGRIDEVIEYYPDDSQGHWRDTNDDGLYETCEVRDASGKVLIIEANAWSKGFQRKE